MFFSSFVIFVRFGVVVQQPATTIAPLANKFIAQSYRTKKKRLLRTSAPFDARKKKTNYIREPFTFVCIQCGSFCLCRAPHPPQKINNMWMVLTSIKVFAINDGISRFIIICVFLFFLFKYIIVSPSLCARLSLLSSFHVQASVGSNEVDWLCWGTVCIHFDWT